MSLDNFVAGPFQSVDRDERNVFIKLLAEFTLKMNAGGFINGEYHWRNILVCRTGAGYDFKIIDPSSSRRRYRLFFPFFDLATLDVCSPYFFSTTERVRFFKYYMRCSDVRLTWRQKKLLGKISSFRQIISQKELKRYRHILLNKKPLKWL